MQTHYEVGQASCFAAQLKLTCTPTGYTPYTVAIALPKGGYGYLVNWGLIPGAHTQQDKPLKGMPCFVGHQPSSFQEFSGFRLICLVAGCRWLAWLAEYAVLEFYICFATSCTVEAASSPTRGTSAGVV